MTSDLPVSLTGRALLTAMAGYAGERWYVWPSAQRLADALKISIRSVRTALNELISAKLIKAAGKIRRKIAYTFLWHDALEEKHIDQVVVRTYPPEVTKKALTPRSARSAHSSVQILHTILKGLSSSESSINNSNPKAPVQPATRRSAQVSVAEARDMIPQSEPQNDHLLPHFETAISTMNRYCKSKGHTGVTLQQHEVIQEYFRHAGVPEVILAHCIEVTALTRKVGGNPAALLWYRLFLTHDKRPSDTALREAKHRLFGSSYELPKALQEAVEKIGQRAS